MILASQASNPARVAFPPERVAERAGIHNADRSVAALTLAAPTSLNYYRIYAILRRVLMKPRQTLALCALTLAVVAAAQQPPLIDRELIFGDPEISGAQLSPDGKFMSFIKPLAGTRNIFVKKAGEPFDAAKPVTNDTKRPIPQYFWTRDSKYILYTQDNAGDENFNLYAVNPADPPAAGSPVPAARNVTDLKGVRVLIFAVPKTDPDIAYIGLNDRDKAWHDLYKLKISTGERTLLRKNTDRIGGWDFDHAGMLRLAERSAENGDTEVLRVDADKFTKIYTCGLLESCNVLDFDKANKLVYVDTNHGEGDLSRLALLDPATGKETFVESDPLKRVDLSAAVFSDLTEELIATIYTDEKQRRYYRDKAFEADMKWLEAHLPGKDVNRTSVTKDEQTWLVAATSDNDPGSVYLFDRKTKKLTLQYKIREKLNRDYLASTTPIKYKSSDGLEIPAYLTLPKGVPAKNLPLIVFPHGGPWARDAWGYNSYWQFFANRGYAVLAPNFRGSVTYGKKFLDAGNKQWGDKMQDDITWGVKDLVAKGIADPKRVGISGGSYGGYATLAGVAFTPDVYAAAVSIVGPSNLLTLLDSIPPYWEAGRVVFYTRMGDPTTAEGKAQLQRQSPLNSAAKIRTPLMVVQGANDPRVNKAESDQIVIALRDRGFPVEYIVAPDEGHGFARPVNNMAMMAAAEKFLAGHLNGRFQDGGTPEVVARLKEITVDPKTVVLARKVDPSAVGAPKPTAMLTPGSYKYSVKASLGGQTLNLSEVIEVKKDGAGWTVVQTANTPMGESTDTAILDADNLTLRKRTVKSGPLTIDVEVKGNKASGKISGMGPERAIDVDLGGPLFADAGDMFLTLATLPLKAGYTTSYRNFDTQKLKTKVMQLTVTGAEHVTVAAGSFDTYKLEITSDAGDKFTAWVDKAARKPVKMEQVIPSMGGATLVTELQP
jgi:dipeptidyl aminopeptidase/acylaminoacyl peptidase